MFSTQLKAQIETKMDVLQSMTETDIKNRQSGADESRGKPFHDNCMTPSQKRETSQNIQMDRLSLHGDKQTFDPIIMKEDCKTRAEKKAEYEKIEKDFQQNVEEMINPTPAPMAPRGGAKRND